MEKEVRRYIVVAIIIIIAIGILFLVNNTFTGNITGKAIYGIASGESIITLQDANIENIGDAEVKGDQSNTNYGSGEDLEVKWGTPKRVSYIMFNLSSIPSNQIIDNSSVCLYLYNDQGSQTIGAYHVYETFNESAITWNTQPCGSNFDDSNSCNLTAEDTIATDTIMDDSWLCWDVSNMVSDEYSNDNASITIAFYTGDTGNADQFHSKEYTTSSLRPYLNVTYHSSNNPPTPSLVLPENTTYSENESLALNFTISDDNDAVANLTCWYNIDDGSNVSMTNCENTTFDVSDSTSHTLKIFANDSEGEESSDNVVFTVDSLGISVSISEPTGTKTSRTSIPLQYIATGNNLSCWYNIKTSIGGDVISNTTLANCSNTTFDVSNDGDYILNLYANNTFGSSDSDNSSFTISTSSSPPPSGGGGGGGGSSRTTIIQPTNLTIEITVSNLNNMVVNSGDTKKITWKVKNTGTSFLNDCNLEGIGQYASWISSTGVKDLAAGEEYDFIFTLNVPEDISVGKYGLGVVLNCQETNKGTEFTAEILEKKLDLEIIEVVKNEDNALNLVYSIEEFSGLNQEVNLQFILFTSNNQKIAEVTDIISVKADSGKEYTTRIPFDSSFKGEFKIIINFNSDVYSGFVEESLVLGEGGGISGFTIFGESQKVDNIIALVLVIGFIVITVLVVKKIIKSRKKRKK